MLAILLLLTTTLIVGADTVPAQPVDFNRQIRPLLVEHCLACHGPDEKTRKAGLRLDGPKLAQISLKRAI